MWKDSPIHFPVCFLNSRLQMQGKGHPQEIIPRFYEFFQRSCKHTLSNKVPTKKIFSRVVLEKMFFILHDERVLKEEGLVRRNTSDY